MADGLVAKTWIAERPVSGSDLVLEVQRAPFDVPCDRFTRSCLQAAFERWIEITLRLEGTGFCLSDAHFGNYMLFGRNEPRWIDLGSIRPIEEVTPDIPFRSFDELWKGMLAPLLVLRQSPHRARLVRLAIADYPYQGPRTVAHEAPLPLEEFVASERAELLSALGTATGRDAILKTFEFACAKLGDAFSRPAVAAAPAPVDPGFVGDILAKAGARRVACLGADVYAAFAGVLEEFDTVVIDEDEERLEQLAPGLKTRSHQSGTVALYLEHVVNRIFMQRPPQADAVVAFDPFRRFEHNSDVMRENIAAILASMATTTAVITAPKEFAAPLARLLQGFFADVATEPARSDYVALVCRKSAVGIDPYVLDRSVMMHSLSQLQKATNQQKIRRDLAAVYASSITDALTVDGGRIVVPPTPKGIEDGRQLTEMGLAELGQVLTSPQVREIVAYFKERPIYASHVATKAEEPPSTIEAIRDRFHYGAYDVGDILAAPYLWELANSADLLSAAAIYLGCVPSLYSVNCWWTFGGHETPAAVAQRLHRDPDDFRFCTLFVYLTDVGGESGPHIYVTESHNCERFDPELQTRLVRAGMEPAAAEQMINFTYYKDGNEAPLDDMVTAVMPERLRTLTGRAGSALLEDTYGLHRGASLSRIDRLMFWARYGLGPNYAYDLDKTRPRKLDWHSRLPDTPLTRYVNRLIVDPR
jgi:hypothetical protein